MTLMEMVVVLAVIGIMMGIAAPRLRTSERTKAYEAARQLAVDIEAVRTRSLAATAATQIVFDPTARTYSGYLDWDRDGTVAQNQAGIDSLQVLRPRMLPSGLIFDRGGASLLPGFGGSGPVTFPGNTLAFDARGITTPIGTRGVVYLRSSADPNAVSAVSITGASNVRVWRWIGGAWQ